MEPPKTSVLEVPIRDISNFFERARTKPTRDCKGREAVVANATMEPKGGTLKSP